MFLSRLLMERALQAFKHSPYADRPTHHMVTTVQPIRATAHGSTLGPALAG